MPAAQGVPTHVGMDRSSASRCLRRIRSPHARGDGPFTGNDGVTVNMESPRTWGWTARSCLPNLNSRGVPTHVGMDRHHYPRHHYPRRSPHARGDGPYFASVLESLSRESPRTWGWTEYDDCQYCRGTGVPTHVGMDREKPSPRCMCQWSPHARGDGPRETEAIIEKMKRSPHARGGSATLTRRKGGPSMLLVL